MRSIFGSRDFAHLGLRYSMPYINCEGSYHLVVTLRPFRAAELNILHFATQMLRTSPWQNDRICTSNIYHFALPHQNIGSPFRVVIKINCHNEYPTNRRTQVWKLLDLPDHPADSADVGCRGEKFHTKSSHLPTGKKLGPEFS